MASMAETLPEAPPRLARRHSGWVRATHWLNAVAIAFLLMSGLNIFNAHPRLYWAEAGSVDDRRHQWLEIGSGVSASGAPVGYVEVLGQRFGTTGVLGVSTTSDGRPNYIGYPSWATFPSVRDLATARNWHFFWAWVLILNGLVYLGYGLVSGHIARDLLPRLRELSPRHVWHDIVQHLKLNFPRGEAALRYEILQKLAYVGVALVLVPLVIFTGLAMSPGMNAAWPLLPDVFGGRQAARSLHWIAANLILLFVVVHVVMVVLSGPINNLRGMITGAIRVTP